MEPTIDFKAIVEELRDRFTDDEKNSKPVNEKLKERTRVNLARLLESEPDTSMNAILDKLEERWRSDGLINGNKDGALAVFSKQLMQEKNMRLGATMQQQLLISYLSACPVNWMAGESLAEGKLTPGIRVISTPTEHYWVMMVDGFEQKHGTYARLHRNGKKRVDGSYFYGKKNGLWQYWTKTGWKIKEESYLMGKKHRLWIQWYAKGNKKSEGCYENDRPVKTHRQWHENGVVKSETIYQKKENGVSAHRKTWTRSGKPHSEYALFNDKMHGLYISWYPNEQVRVECHYDGGRRQGKYLEWYSDGEPKAEHNYDKGCKIGTSNEWYENRQMCATGVYNTKGKDGIWTYWQESGAIHSHITYRDGEIVEE
ncbi:MAG: hypothetical protein HKM93_00760 [Desulfobacteraceae bacterium]|nr:hypothetical protein [Desulfobacteraceae bacterium]